MFKRSAKGEFSPLYIGSL